MVRALVTGASGYVGSRLVCELHCLGESVGCVVRDPSRVDFEQGVTVHRADMLDPSSLSAIGDSYTTAYYLVHSMGRGGDRDYEWREGRPGELTPAPSDGASMTTVELLDALTTSLQHP
jgi:uncharacterized protein YbjT (DUF2867 family)